MEKYISAILPISFCTDLISRGPKLILKWCRQPLFQEFLLISEMKNAFPTTELFKMITEIFSPNQIVYAHAHLNGNSTNYG